ncbi:MAG: hypothetical protein GY719_26055 [bacterium]|nr:hypothetical protein [bacterium]
MHEIARPDRKLIPRMTRTAGYQVDVGWDYLEEHLGGYRRCYALDLSPDFQRGYKWDDKDRADGLPPGTRKKRYVENALRGGSPDRRLFFNCPNWQGAGEVGDMVLVDGKQRLDAVRGFLANELEVFGGWKLRDFGARLLRFTNTRFQVHVNDLPTRAEVLQWYLDINDGGVAHTAEEIDRVRELLGKERADV